jgi:uncharacterized protein (TIGR00730 family)
MSPIMPDATRQKTSSSYLLPAEDTEFMLNRREMRGLRFAMDYSKADLLLRDWHVRSTIICFGSARTPSPEQVAELEAAAVSGDAPTRDKATRARKLSVYYETARTFGRLVSERGGALDPVEGWRDNVIATGGGPGIMEAANRGASEAGAPTIGFNITLAHEQEPNAYSTPELTFRFHYFAMRKMHLAMRARALAVFPGGFGTMDELFEILTLQQTGKAKVVPVVLVGRDYWERVVNFDVMLEYGVVSAPDRNLYEIVDTAEEAWNSLLKRGLQVPAAL